MNDETKRQLAKILTEIDALVLCEDSNDNKVHAMSHIVQHCTLHVIPMALKEALQSQEIPASSDNKTLH